MEAEIVVAPAIGTVSAPVTTGDVAAGVTATGASAAKKIPALSSEAVPHIRSHSNSGCLWEQCWPSAADDIVSFTPMSGALYVAHMNTTYNCCLDDIVVSLTVNGDHISLFEEEILTEPCWCVCCFDFDATVAGLTPGQYTVEYGWHDYQQGPRCYSATVVIPQPARPLAPPHARGENRK